MINIPLGTAHQALLEQLKDHFIPLSEHFDSIAKKEIEPEAGQYHGICEELSVFIFNFIPASPLHSNALKVELRKAFESWPHFSGDIVYPVPPCKGFMCDDSDDSPYAEIAFDDCDDCWADDEYGDLRRDLCAHVATHFRKLLQEIEK